MGMQRHYSFRAQGEHNLNETFLGGHVPLLPTPICCATTQGAEAVVNTYTFTYMQEHHLLPNLLLVTA